MPPQSPTSSTRSRRAVLGYLAAGLAAPGLATPAIAARPAIPKVDLENPHTGEALRTALVENGAWIEEGLAELSHFVRDWREDVSMPIDKRVALILLKTRMILEPDRPTQILSGYRTARTNSRLSGAARNSLHLRAMALDIRQPGVAHATLHRAAVSLQDGGVGNYPRDGFVHIDCGRVRHWTA